MKKTLISLLGIAALTATPSMAERLVILHTNDTHSNIESDVNGVGGVLQRKAVIDSVRAAEKNVILIDAGDMVQGTLYFKFWRGEVEYPLFNMMDYDIRILGNHEFDNGLDELARHYAGIKKADRLSANYDFSGTPLAGMFKPYVIKKVNGKKIGFIGLNVDPASLIADYNTGAMRFSDVIETANRLAAELKHKKKCDLVVAVTHIGYDDQYMKASDTDLARASRDIDIIIGGHSHTVVDPAKPEENPSLVPNADGRPVLIAQTGRYGRYVGYISIDLDHLKGADGSDFDYRLIPVTDRFDPSVFDKRISAFLEPYKHRVDSVNRRVIAYSGMDMTPLPNSAYANFAGDFGLWYGRHVVDSINAAGGNMPKVDFAVMNVGGIRQDMPGGPVTEGQILSTFPFSNRVVIMEETGADIISALQAPAPKGGEAVSTNVYVVLDSDSKIKRMYIDGKEVEPDKTYVMASIDYVAAGNDNMTAFANGRELWRDDKEMSAAMMRYIVDFGQRGIPITANPNGRFVYEMPLPQEQ
ncbi:MAG: bifunctional metallophosphatase/5'-nucleotidase [Bacteroides sp.]|nr:bifunctional metallophosphatase/5'-nucleotidase [Bacteroides sp.]